MCRLRNAVKEVVIGDYDAKVCYRWFALSGDIFNNKLGRTIHTNSVISPVNTNLGNPWIHETAKADIAPLMDISEKDPFTNRTIYKHHANPNGLYAYKTKEHALADGNYSHMILAKIVVWGRCVEHEDGYRAEFARILNLYPTPEMHQVKVTTKKVKAKRVVKVKAKLNGRDVTLRQEKIVTVKRTKVKRLPFATTFKKDCPDLKHVSVIPCNGLQLTI